MAKRLKKEEFAFPSTRDEEVIDPGMTLRDYFAAKAITGLLAAPSQIGDECRGSHNMLAFMAYQIANSMLKWREEV